MILKSLDLVFIFVNGLFWNFDLIGVERQLFDDLIFGFGLLFGGLLFGFGEMSSGRILNMLTIVFNNWWESGVSFLFFEITSKSASLIVAALFIGWRLRKLNSGRLWPGKFDFTVKFLFLCSALVRCLCYWSLDRSCLLVFWAFDFLSWGILL